MGVMVCEAAVTDRCRRPCSRPYGRRLADPRPTTDGQCLFGQRYPLCGVIYQPASFGRPDTLNSASAHDDLSHLPSGVIFGTIRDPVHHDHVV